MTTFQTTEKCKVCGRAIDKGDYSAFNEKCVDCYLNQFETFRSSCKHVNDEIYEYDTACNLRKGEFCESDECPLMDQWNK